MHFHRRTPFGALGLVGFIAIACGETLPSADDPTRISPDGGTDATSGEDEELGPQDSGAFADVVGIDAPVTTCSENGLAARWTFDEGSGAIAADCSGNQNHGLLQKAAKHTPGASAGSALVFDGASWAGFGNPASLDFTGALTVTAWIRSDGDLSNSQYVVGKTSNPEDNGWRLAIRSTRQVSFATAIAGTSGCFAFGGEVAKGKWVHVAGVFRPGTAVEAYLDGVLGEADAPCVGGAMTSVPSTAEVRIGARSDDLSGFVGAVDDVRIYSRALTQAEITALAKP